MELCLEIFSALCSTSMFSINGIQADSSDFGSQCDESRDTAEDYGCGDMRFTRKESSAEILEKYGITESEYCDICDQLEAKLSFGSCGWCV